MGRILIVDDHALVREAMASRLAALDGGSECVAVGSADEALNCLQGGAEIDLVVVDLMLPGDNGFSLLAVLGKRYPDLPVVVVSAIDDEASVQRARRCGASGYVSKASSGDELVDAIRVVLDGGIHLPTAVAALQLPKRAAAAARFGLTAAQARVLELLAAGNSNRAIATLLGVSEATVKVHVTAIFRALGVSSRAQTLVAIARQGTRL